MTFGRKLKSGLAPTGVLRQMLVLHNSFQLLNIRRLGRKDKPPRKLSFRQDRVLGALRGEGLWGYCSPDWVSLVAQYGLLLPPVTLQFCPLTPPGATVEK